MNAQVWNWRWRRQHRRWWSRGLHQRENARKKGEWMGNKIKWLQKALRIWVRFCMPAPYNVKYLGDIIHVKFQWHKRITILPYMNTPHRLLKLHRKLPFLHHVPFLGRGRLLSAQIQLSPDRTVFKLYFAFDCALNAHTRRSYIWKEFWILLRERSHTLHAANIRRNDKGSWQK